MRSALSSCRCKVCTRAVASRRAFASASAFSVIACIAAVKHAKHAPHMQPPEGRRFSAAAAGDGVSVATMPARRCSFCRRSIIVRAVSSADFCVVCSICLPVASKPAIRAAAAKSGPRHESVATVSAGWTWSFSSWTALSGSDPGVRQCLSASCRGSSVNNEGSDDPAGAFAFSQSARMASTRASSMALNADGGWTITGPTTRAVPRITRVRTPVLTTGRLLAVSTSVWGSGSGSSSCGTHDLCNPILRCG